MKLLDRQIEPVLLGLYKQYPVITITGPRQSGKTTLVKKLFPQKEYISLENPDIRQAALLDPRAFLKKIKPGAILDEIQRTPELLSYLQEIVDSSSKKGLYILTGSNQLELLKNITQTLAGRTALLKLLPFTIGELKPWTTDIETDHYLYYGFYPGIYKEDRDPTIAYRSYYETFIERDLRQLINLKDLSLFQKFVRLCAGRIGQIFNANNLANETGVSVPTINSWISILHTSYVIMLLQPFHKNINKRLTKSPKLYFYDVGLASYLLGLEDLNQISRDPLRGALFENMVIMELVKTRYNMGLDHNLTFFRDSHQNEVDIIYKKASLEIPIEIKSAQTYNSAFTKGLAYFKKLFPKNVENGFVIYDGDFEQSIGPFDLLNYRRVVEIVQT